MTLIQLQDYKPVCACSSVSPGILWKRSQWNKSSLFVAYWNEKSLKDFYGRADIPSPKVLGVKPW